MSVIYKGRFFNSIRELHDDISQHLDIPYSTLVSRISTGKTAEQAIAMGNKVGAKRRLRKGDIPCDNYSAEKIIRDAGESWYDRWDKDSILKFRGIPKTLSTWATIVGKDVDELINRCYKYKRASTILGVRAGGRHLGTTVLSGDKVYQRDTQLILHNDMLLTRKEINNL